MEIIKFFDVPEWAQLVSLEKTTYQLVARYNAFFARWEMDINTAQYEPIVTGIAILAGFPLLAQHRDARLPSGDFLLVGDDEANYHNLVNGVVSLIYYTKTELLTDDE